MLVKKSWYFQEKIFNLIKFGKNSSMLFRGVKNILIKLRLLENVEVL